MPLNRNKRGVTFEIVVQYAHRSESALRSFKTDSDLHTVNMPGRFLLAKLPGRMSWNGRVIPPTFSLMVMRKADRSCRSDEELESLHRVLFYKFTC